MLIVLILSLLIGLCVSYRMMGGGKYYLISVGLYTGCLWGLATVFAYDNNTFLEHLFNLFNLLLIWGGLGFLLHIIETYFKKIWSIILQAPPTIEK